MILWQIFLLSHCEESYSGSLKNVIMGKVDIATFKEETRVAKERVGKSEHKEEKL